VVKESHQEAAPHAATIVGAVPGHDAGARSTYARGRSGRLRLVAAVVGIGVLIRAALVLSIAGGPGPTAAPDSQDYLRLAHHLGQLLKPPPELLGLTVFHPPGYPAVVWLGELLGGGAGILAIQVLLAAITLVAVYGVGQRISGHAAGLTALVIVAIEPLSILYTGLVMSETAFTALMICSVWVLLRCWDSASWRVSLMAGFLLGLAVLIRPVALYLPALLVPATAVVVSQSRRRKAVMAGVLLMGFLLPVGAWVLRNAEVAGGPMLSSVDSYNLLAYRAADAVARDTGVSRDAASRTLTDQARSRVRSGDSLYAVASVERYQALRAIGQHPTGMVISSAEGFAHLAVAPGLGALDMTRHGLPKAIRGLFSFGSTIIAAIALLAAIVGVVILVRHREWRAVLGVGAVAAYLIAVSSGAEGEARFRVPILPLLAILAGPVLVALVKNLPRRR
jgi:hypothetical protein